MRRAAIALAALLLSAASQAGRWVEVSLGTFTVPPEVLVSIKTSLPAEIARATTARGHDAIPWGDYLVQYRGVTLGDERTVEIHGSCAPPPADFNLRGFFLDEAALDGGECFFTVNYSIATKRYTKLAFHGYA